MDGSPSLLRLRVKAYGLQADRVAFGNETASLWKGERLDQAYKGRTLERTVFFFFSRSHNFLRRRRGAPNVLPRLLFFFISRVDTK